MIFCTNTINLEKGLYVHKTPLLAKNSFIVVGMQLGFNATPAEWKGRLYTGCTQG